MKLGLLTTAAIAALAVAVPATAVTVAGPGFKYSKDEARALNGKQFQNDFQLDYFRTWGELPTPGAIITTPPEPAAPVPEPATWAMMIGGFGLIGTAMRRRVALTA